MSNKFIRWLYRELPELVSKGILSGEGAAKIKDYYGNIENGSKKNVALVVFSILGTFLIGSGMILLLAHNWTSFSRPLRTFIALTPLVLAQLMCGWTIWRRNGSIAWREGSATFLTLAIGAAIALISQTYHLPSDMANFLFLWMLLTVPLVYLIRATFPAILYLIGITTWSGFAQWQQGQAALFWPLAAFVIPHLWFLTKEKLYGGRTSILSWAIAFCLCIGTGIALERTLPGTWIIVYGGLFAVMYLVGNYWFSEGAALWQRPFQTVGAGGTLVLSFMLTYQWPWKNIGWTYYRPYGQYHPLATIVDYLVIGTVITTAVYLLVLCLRQKKNISLFYGSIAVMTLVGYSLSGAGTNFILPPILFNIYIFALSISTLASGIRNGRLGTVNLGMLILMILIMARFFDSDLGFIIRGVVFIILGICFLTTNLLFVRRRGGVQ